MIDNIINSFRYKLFFIVDNNILNNVEMKNVLKTNIISALRKMDTTLIDKDLDSKCINFTVDIPLYLGKNPSNFLNILKDKIKSNLNTKENSFIELELKKVIDSDDCYLVPISINTKTR